LAILFSVTLVIVIFKGFMVDPERVSSLKTPTVPMAITSTAATAPVISAALCRFASASSYCTGSHRLRLGSSRCGG